MPLLAATVSCSKKEAPAPTTGGIEGTVSPANALSQVTATNAGGLAFLAAPAAGTGAFALTNLAPGRYSLSFTPAAGYAAPAPRALDVVAGQTATAGTVVVAGDGTPRGTIAWTVDGITLSSTVLAGTVRALGGVTDIRAFATSGGVQHEVSFYFSDHPAGLGTYTLFANGPGYNSGGYTRTTGGVLVSYGTYLQQTGSGSGAAGQGAFTVAAYNAAARAMSGTFAFTAINTDGGPANVRTATISNGSFSLSY